MLACVVLCTSKQAITQAIASRSLILCSRSLINSLIMFIQQDNQWWLQLHQSMHVCACSAAELLKDQRVCLQRGSLHCRSLRRDNLRCRQAPRGGSLRHGNLWCRLALRDGQPAVCNVHYLLITLLLCTTIPNWFLCVLNYWGLGLTAKDGVPTAYILLELTVNELCGYLM